MANEKADLLIEKQRSAMRNAHALEKELTGRYVKNDKTGHVFLWTPAAHTVPHLRLLDEDYVRPKVEPDTAYPAPGSYDPAAKTDAPLTTEQIKQMALDAGLKLADEDAPVVSLADMDLDQLREVAIEVGVPIGNLKDLDKIRTKILEAQESSGDTSPPAE